MRRWDIFCKVIDNFGDIGVCWRLARSLAQRGQTVRLWLDDASALAWMAPEGTWPEGLSVHHWPADAPALAEGDASPPAGTSGAPSRGQTSAPTGAPAWPEPGDIVIESFGCELPEGFVARMQRPAPPVWINLEYLSAEDYVERSHQLPSPVFSGPGVGLKKWFFYPGFTRRTGGLLREPGLLQARDAFQQAGDSRAKQDFLASLGVHWHPGERVVSVFCYPRAPVAAMLDHLKALPGTTHVLLTPGAATDQARTWLAGTAPLPPTDRHPHPLPQVHSRLHLHFLPLLPQPAFDHLLWSADLNVVRGEDSAVRALWAARPHVWHIYPQDDGVHADKLDAFTARWMADWPQALREPVRRVWAAWNQLPGSQVDDLSLLRTLLGAPEFGTSAELAKTLAAAWPGASAASSAELAKQDDLVEQLLQFVTAPG